MHKISQQFFDFVDHRVDVGEGDVVGDVVGGEDEAVGAEGGELFADVAADGVGGAVGDGETAVETAVKHEFAAIIAFERGAVVDIGLEGVDAVESAFDNERENRRDIASAGVVKNF